MTSEQITTSATNHGSPCPYCGYPLPNYAQMVAEVSVDALKKGYKMGDQYQTDSECSNCGEKYEATITVTSN